MKSLLSSLLLIPFMLGLSACASAPEPEKMPEPTPGPEAKEEVDMEESDEILDLRMENALKELDLVE